MTKKGFASASVSNVWFGVLATKEAGSLKKMKGKMRKMVGDEKAGVCGSCLGSDMAN